MKIKFLYSKIKEQGKLIDIHDEYQWFLDNNFPLILPKFYSEINIIKDKKIFKKELEKRFDEVFNKDEYTQKIDKIKDNWQKIEKQFFDTIKELYFPILNNYICYISFYGPEGQFEFPNKINVRISNEEDLKNANETIAHELVHLFIYSTIKKLNLNYEEMENTVDLFFTETDLKKIFKNYKRQNLTSSNKETFKRVIESK